MPAFINFIALKVKAINIKNEAVRLIRTCIAAFINAAALAYTIAFVALFLIVHVATYPLRLSERLYKRTCIKMRTWRRNHFLRA